jgi:hypothetical protein
MLFSSSNFLRLFEMNFQRSWIERERQISWPLCSPDLMRLDFSLWGYVKDVLCSQKVNKLDERKAWITAEIANVTKDMLQRVWQEVGCMQSYRLRSL